MGLHLAPTQSQCVTVASQPQDSSSIRVRVVLPPAATCPPGQVPSCPLPCSLVPLTPKTSLLPTPTLWLLPPSALSGGLGVEKGEVRGAPCNILGLGNVGRSCPFCGLAPP